MFASVIVRSSAFKTSSRVACSTCSFTVSRPAKVSFLRSGLNQIAYSLGRTCFGNLPGVLAKSKGFSAFNAVTIAKTYCKKENPIYSHNNGGMKLHLRRRKSLQIDRTQGKLRNLLSGAAGAPPSTAVPDSIN